MSDEQEQSPAGEAERRAQRLEANLAGVTARVFALERQMAMLSGRENPGASPSATGAAVHPAPSGAPMQAPTPVAALKPLAAAERGQTLESRVGSQWFNRIGILAVLIGVAWFLEFAFENHWVGALGRVLIGLACGVALVLWSERFRAKGFAGFSYSLKALGTGVLYLSLWAAVSLYHLIAPGVGFAGMVAVTAWNAFVAWTQDAELLAVYAIVGAFATPLLLSSGRNEEVFLFSYLLLMNAAMLALLVVKGWNRLLVLAFLGTVGLYCGWYWNYYAAAAFGTTLLFLLVFFLLFVAATVLGRRRNAAGQANAAQDDVARVFVGLANAGLAFLSIYAMLAGDRGADTERAGWALGFAAFYLGVRRGMRGAALTAAVPAALADLHLTLAIAFATLAIPLAVHGHWVTVGWMAEGAALVWLAARRRSLLIELLAAGALLLGLVSLAMDATVGQQQVIWNTRFLSFAVAIAAMAATRWVARRRAVQGENAERWGRASIAAELTAGLLVVIAGVEEIHTWWWTRALTASVGTRELRDALQDRAQAAQFTYSAWFLLLSMVALAAGFRRRSALLRWQGLVLLAVTILKVFLVDTSELSQGYRIVSFLLLGALLLGVSFAYQKDWLRLRG